MHDSETLAESVSCNMSSLEVRSFMQCSFEDSRGWCCAAYNEVAIDYNAAFTGALARLVDYYQDMHPFSDCSLDLGWSHANATLVSP